MTDSTTKKVNAAAQLLDQVKSYVLLEKKYVFSPFTAFPLFWMPAMAASIESLKSSAESVSLPARTLAASI